MGKSPKAPRQSAPVAPAPVMQEASVEQQTTEESKKRLNRKGRLSAFQILGRQDQAFGG
jgi:hypothetical protein